MSLYKECEKESEYVYSLSSFYRKDKREFYFLVDSTQKLAENINLVSNVIKSIYAEQMKEKDIMTVTAFDEGIYPVISQFNKQDQSQERDTSTFDKMMEEFR